MRKGDKVHYTSGLGYPYSAYVKRAHKNGSFTVQLYYPVDQNGFEITSCMQGDKFRVGPERLSPWASVCS